MKITFNDPLTEEQKEAIREGFERLREALERFGKDVACFIKEHPNEFAALAAIQKEREMKSKPLTPLQKAALEALKGRGTVTLEQVAESHVFKLAFFDHKGKDPQAVTHQGRALSASNALRALVNRLLIRMDHRPKNRNGGGTALYWEVKQP